MSAKPIPETANRQDWPRLVAAANKDHEGRIASLETGGLTRAKGRFIYG